MMWWAVQGRRVGMPRVRRAPSSYRGTPYMEHAARRRRVARRPDYIAVLGTHRAACHGDQHRMSGSEFARATFVVPCCHTTIGQTLA